MTKTIYSSKQDKKLKKKKKKNAHVRQWQGNSFVVDETEMNVRKPHFCASCEI